MKLSKFDIGAEIIAILTKGMYQDPRDALREYIQNSVDAESTNINVKVRQNMIIVEDDGIGMTHKSMRKALRVGVSDKKPGKDVGFMGIGIYSAFHLCETLLIYSKAEGQFPNCLKMDFKGMKELLAKQKDLRQRNELSGDELIDLQTLLEKFIVLTDDGELVEEDFPSRGTRIELISVEPNFYTELTQFEYIANYLRDVVPLHFDYNKFTWGEQIDNKISQICDQHEAKFETVNVELQVNNQIEKLYKPYTDKDFHNSVSQEPIFQEITNGQIFIGVVWGCLNSTRNKIQERNKRGFLIKKQGFAIGRRENVVKYFNSNTHFDRYIGEIIVVHPKLLPNASRDDFEFTKLRTIFYELLANVGGKFNYASNEFQNSTKAIERIEEITSTIKGINMKFSGYENNAEELVKYIVTITKLGSEVDSILRRNVLKDISKDNAQKLCDSISDLKQNIQSTINRLTQENEKVKRRKKSNQSKTQIAKNLSSIGSAGKVDTVEFENLLAVFKDLDIELNPELTDVVNLIDEQFIQSQADTKLEYEAMLKQLRDDILNMNN